MTEHKIVEFGQLDRHSLFELNGNQYVKQSTRTAKMMANGRVFYIKKKENVKHIPWPKWPG